MHRRRFLQSTMGAMAILPIISPHAFASTQRGSCLHWQRGGDLLLPRPLPGGGCIGVIAPAGPRPSKVADVIQWIEARGYQARAFPGCFEETGYLAGSDLVRLRDLHAAFADPQVDAIICLRGGYGSMRLLDSIDYPLIRKHPKILVGYSDITALHHAILQHAGLLTFHGPMLASDLAIDKKPPTSDALFTMLSGQQREGSWIEHPLDYPLLTLVPGRATGRLSGGNLAMLCATMGTPYEAELDGAILFLEEVGESAYRVDRLLTQLRLAGKLRSLRGVLVGDLSPLSGAPLIDLLMQIFEPLGIPVLFGWRSGHIDPNLTLPMGANVLMDATQQRLQLLQDVVAREASAHR